MANLAVSRVGQANGAGDAKAIFLKVFSGEVLMAFKESTTMLDKHSVRTIASGKSAQFPKMGRSQGYYHVPGEELSVNSINHAETVITIDDLLVVPHAIAQIDELMNHYDVRSRYAQEIGNEAGQIFDNHVIIEGLLGARSANDLTELPGGFEYIDDNLKNDGGVAGSSDDAGVALALITGIYQAAEKFDDNFVPDSDRYCALRPHEYYILVKEVQTNGFSAINKDFGGEGSFAMGNVIHIAGIKIVKFPQLPKTNIASSGTNTFHYGDFTKTVGFVWHTSAVGTVKLLGMQMESEWNLLRQSYILLAKYAMGHKVLRNEACVELKLNTLTV